MSDEMNEGDWVVVGKTSDWGRRVTTFDAAQVTKVTAKLVYANAHYGKQHPREMAVRMPDEAAARLFVERAKSAYAEASRRQIAAWKAYNDTIAKMLPKLGAPA